MTDAELLPPARDELEVSVFGPGYGESIVVHIGEGQWLIVDSCQQKGVDLPAPLDYLLRLGVEPQDAVKLIVATHWHDDHIRGMAKIINVCESAPFVCSSALQSEEFRTIAYILQDAGGTTIPTGAAEMGAVFTRLSERKKAGTKGSRIQYPELKLALADRTLFRHKAQINGETEVTVESLSPSDAAVSQAVASFAILAQDQISARKHISPLSQNHASVVLWIGIGDQHFLFGADLEVTKNSDIGWLAILASPYFSDKANVFKVPHHGSQNGDHEDIWLRLLEPHPIAVLTPYRRGRYMLPTGADIKRLLLRTPNLYLTAPSISRRTKWRGVEKQFVELMTKDMTEYSSGWGHVRLRRNIGATGQWRVDLFGDAQQLTTQ